MFQSNAGSYHYNTETKKDFVNRKNPQNYSQKIYTNIKEKITHKWEKIVSTHNWSCTDIQSVKRTPNF